MVAIIASLLVISIYIALRFEWKFAVPVFIALMHDLLITAGVYSLTGREVTTATVAALLTILGYSLYDTIIVFDRVRENVPRMPRAAFSQIVNRSMSEVMTRSLATTSCTLMPILALLFFGGATLKDFAFALLIGVASGAYSSIFIASPVLTHWKEREHGYRARRLRIEEDQGDVPAYAGTGTDVEPDAKRSRRPGRLTTARARWRVGGRVRADEARHREEQASPPDIDAASTRRRPTRAPASPSRGPHERARRARGRARDAARRQCAPKPETPPVGKAPPCRNAAGRQWRPKPETPPVGNGAPLRRAAARARHRRE